MRSVRHLKKTISMKKNISESEFFGSERIGKVLLKIAPPVMLAQLIQALYNIVDSFFVGKYSDAALTALTVIFPIQLIIVALAVGTGVGVNTYMARKFAQGKEKDAFDAAGTGTVLALITWAVFSIISTLLMRPYVMASAKTPLAVEYAITYPRQRGLLRGLRDRARAGGGPLLHRQGGLCLRQPPPARQRQRRLHYQHQQCECRPRQLLDRR